MDIVCSPATQPRVDSLIKSDMLLRVFVCWLCLSAIALMYGREVSLWLLPSIKLVGEWFQPAFNWGLAVEEYKDSVVIALRATSIEQVPAGPTSALNQGTVIRAGSTLVHIMLPSIIWVCVLVIWPCVSYAERAVVLCVGFVASQATAIFLAALLLSAKIEIMLENVAQQANERRPESLLTDLMVFIETGGNIVIALVGAVVCGAAVSGYFSASRVNRAKTLPEHH